MAVRKGSAEWNGDLKGGKGMLSSESGALSNIAYNFVSRFEEGNQTNPEELLGAAHAACFSMALANNLSKEGFKVNSIKTVDHVHLEKQEAGFTITKIVINTEGKVEGIDEATFKKHAENTKASCPVSRALKVEMNLNVKLV
ncbi:MAG: OsmC family peroxiredoxin [Ignavibacteria bacterium GWA2_35_9]|nr:MAG: OsmC family peroxiredoxin [Ignavibacteria bacterium GWA2_35_9]OGU48146.1 MAG: OsmC family peroxiredoxin [Ignavibacteria bacterium GWB2_36_8]OGU52391.1 MAG: OsmC family peroxiredoxin [Ignavibacteria bacterium GWC2_36_12]OGV03658.1 MAG: OsmC family peroxiredoxin [Ignavibacteria bacterium RIFOXYB2_FULL_36_7]